MKIEMAEAANVKTGETRVFDAHRARSVRIIANLTTPVTQGMLLTGFAPAPHPNRRPLIE